MNSINLVGRVGKDVESSSTGGGTTVAKFSLAVDRGRKDKDGNKVTDWFTVKAFGKTAETVQAHVKKGDRIGVTGSMLNDPYTPRGEDKKRDYWQVNADRVEFLNDKADRAQDGHGGSAPAPARNAARGADVSEEIPF